MATKKQLSNTAGALLGIDVAQYTTLREEIEQKATAAIAERVQVIKTALSELKTIVSVSGITVNVQEIISEFEDAREDLDPNTDWNSSSAYC